MRLERICDVCAGSHLGDLLLEDVIRLLHAVGASDVSREAERAAHHDLRKRRDVAQAQRPRYLLKIIKKSGGAEGVVRSAEKKEAM